MEGVQCQWCWERVEFREFEVDHIIPEKYIDDPVELAKLLAIYKREEGFELNDFENWTCLHSSCNKRKLANIFEGVGLVLQDPSAPVEDRTQVCEAEPEVITHLLMSVHPTYKSSAGDPFLPPGSVSS